MSTETLAEAVWRHAREQPDQPAFVFHHGDIDNGITLTYGEVGNRVRDCASLLFEKGCQGERVLLLCEPGLDYLVGFLSCLCAGVTAVPAYPPDPARYQKQIDRLLGIASDAQSKAVLVSPFVAQFLEAQPAALERLSSAGVVKIGDESSQEQQLPAVHPSDLAFLQYTSGSTGQPKGVMLSHANLMSNIKAITAEGPKPPWRGASWLPPYHDMGLIGCMLTVFWQGGTMYLISPYDFLVRPRRWVQLMSKYKCHATAAPNFALGLTARKTTEEEKAALDLSNMQCMFIGAERLRADSVSAFMEQFGPCGLADTAIRPCYGLAEGTLMVTITEDGEKPKFLRVDRGPLEQGIATLNDASEDTLKLASLGRAIDATSFEIHATEAPHAQLPLGKVGEIWFSGPGLCQGYWRKEQLNVDSFVERGGERWFRTGDLGFVTEDGELVVCGREKDLIIVDGRNVFPSDLEIAAETACAAIRPGCSAAFAVDDGGTEQVVLVAEYDRRRAERRQAEAKVGSDRRKDSDRRSQPLLPTHQVETSGALDDENKLIVRRLTSDFGLESPKILFVTPGTIPKTSSGKVRRRATREAFLAGQLDELS